VPLELYLSTAGKYSLRDDTRSPQGIRTYSARGNTRLPGTPVTSADKDSWETGVSDGKGAAVDAHYFAGITYDYLSRVLSRQSLDGKDGGIRLSVHFGQAMDNAFFDGKHAVFGDGDGTQMRALSGGLDVVAHELFHGVTMHDSGLTYAGESGALNESLSDVFGTLVELDHGHGNWTIGEAVSLTGKPLRDLGHPNKVGLPSHMSQYVQLAEDPQHDMGGVHINSSIPSNAAYLVGVGGTQEVSGIHVTAIGVDKLTAIWYRAAHIYLGPDASFADFAEATRTAAADLYGASSAEVKTVENAWRAVGVTE
jgi:thermolysin